MKSVSRGLLAVVGFVFGFLTLVFIFQLDKYLQLALIGDEMSLAMAGVYVILSYTGAILTVLSFKPKATVAKYLGGVGVGIGGLFLLSGFYLFSTDTSSSILLAIYAGVQGSIGAGIYAAGRARGKNGESDSESETTSTEPESHETDSTSTNPDPDTASDESAVEPETPSQNEPREREDTPDSSSDSSRDIDWWTAVQIFAGAAIFLIGIPLTIQSPVGVPILLFGLALIPRIRNWEMETLGGSETG